MRPRIDILIDLLHTAFLTSIATEEATPITCSLAYVNPRDPDPDPPERLRHPRWRIIPLKKPVAYAVAQLSKLAIAADPATSILAVFPDRRGELRVWGFCDQQGGFQAMLSHEGEGGWTPPGSFCIQILGPGHLIVMEDFAVAAEFNKGQLVEDAVDIFSGNIISRKLAPAYRRRLSGATTLIEREGYSFAAQDYVKHIGPWYKLIRRILLRARSYRHGAAFLITDSDVTDRVDVKHVIRYERLPELFEHWAANEYIEGESDFAIQDALDNAAADIDATLYLANACAHGQVDDSTVALTGAIEFVASLSRTDGLVLMNTDLVVLGFGCEVTVADTGSCSLYSASHAFPSKGRLRKLDIRSFGTRHRSMIRYCSADRDAVGFVLSSDGPVRAITRSGLRVYCWPNVELAWRARQKRQ